MKSEAISLFQEAGEFCSERSHPKLSVLKEKIRQSLSNKTSLQIDRAGVKILTTSFIDELLSELAKEFSLPLVQSLILFSPPLDDFYWTQVVRGIQLRTRS